MEYKIKRISSFEEIEKGNVAKININNWNSEYTPECYAILCLLEKSGFVLRITVKEKNPRAEHTEQNTRVCDDSCLEFFANFKPNLENSGYINIEGNAIGSLLCCYGETRNGRKTITEMGFKHPVALPFEYDDCWGYDVLIPLSLIENVYGNSTFLKGDIIKGNFYKCGDMTESPHYLSYTEIKTEQPDFHRPEFFADLIIE